MKTLLRSALICALLALATACGAAGPQNNSAAPEPPAPPTLTPDGAAASFTLDNIDGQPVTLADYLGKNVVLLSFWATWCEPCKRELVQLEQLQQSLGDQGLTVLTVAMDEPETVGDVRPYVKQRGYGFQVLLDTESRAASLYNPRRSAPYSLIIGRDQRVIWTHEGYVPGDETKLEAALRAALGPAQ